MQDSRRAVLSALATIGLVAITILPAYASCIEPNGGAGAREYFPDDDTYKFCDGTDWVDFKTDGTIGTCATAGTLDYDSVESAYKFCDGTNWIKVSCGSSGGGPVTETYDSPGSYDFTVPAYDSLTVKIWGGGAGGGTAGDGMENGLPGTDSRFGASIVAGSGPGGTDGGTASGGDINIAGGDGEDGQGGSSGGGDGGDSPNGGSGGSGGSSGQSGNSPGGGGGGNVIHTYCPSFDIDSHAGAYGGGAGAYAEKTYASGNLTTGGDVTVVVGSGGSGVSSGSETYTACIVDWTAGGDGADGRVEISYTQTPECSALGSCSSAGAIEFLSAESTLAYCDGANWQIMAAPSF